MEIIEEQKVQLSKVMHHSILKIAWYLRRYLYDLNVIVSYVLFLDRLIRNVKNVVMMKLTFIRDRYVRLHNVDLTISFESYL